MIPTETVPGDVIQVSVVGDGDRTQRYEVVE